MILLTIVIILFILFLNLNYDFFNNIDEKYTAVIIEPRKHKALEHVLINFTKNLDSKWNFIIFHGTENEDFVKNILDTTLINEKNRFTLINLHVSNLTIQEYSKIFYSKEFYDKIPTETFLIFQSDTVICDKYKHLLYDFIDYDYVGAPWRKEIDDPNSWLGGGVGNGGLSLRKKSKMLEFLDKCPNYKYTNGEYINEDLYFSIFCKEKINKPNEEKAKEFSIEHLYNDKSFGVHKPWLHVTKDDIEKIIDFCPDLDKLIKFNV